MPRQINLPPFPTITFGVFNQWGREPGHRPLGYSTPEKFRAGYRSDITRGVSMDRDEIQALAVDAWRRSCYSMRRSVLTMEEVFDGRTFVGMGYLGGGYVLHTDGGHCRVSPTRGWIYNNILSLPTGSFTVRRILKDHKTLRLADGGTIVFPKKMHITSIDNQMLDTIFGPLIENSD